MNSRIRSLKVFFMATFIALNSLLISQDQEYFGKPTYRSYHSIADSDSKLILAELRKRETVLRFSSQLPPDWFFDLEVLGGVPGISGESEKRTYWRSESLFIYITPPAARYKAWNSLPEDFPVLTAVKRDSYVVTGIYNKKGENMYEGDAY